MDAAREQAVYLEHVVVDALGTEHVANAVQRRGTAGPRLTCWGQRIVEYPFGRSAEALEVVGAVGEKQYSNGGCALDVNGDGVDELVVGRGQDASRRDPELLWYEEAGAGPWREHCLARHAAGPFTAPHDIVPFAVPAAAGAATRGVVADIGRRQLFLYEPCADPRTPWAVHEVGTFPGGHQSGLTLADLSGSGRPDIVCGMHWLPCPPDPRQGPWPVRRFGGWDATEWGGMAKHAVADVDGDGALEIVACEAEIPSARLGVFRRDAAHPDGLWHCELLDDTLYCPHSLVLADVDGDRHLDIVVGEMTAGGWDFPLNPEPRLWVYLGDGRGGFRKHVLATGWGVHEMRLAEGVAGARLTLYAADEIQPHKFPQMETHVCLWRIG